MELNNLKRRKSARKKPKRVGRGPGSGHGKTATRGHKGQRSRSGSSGGTRPGFEGGQMPLIRRIPKRGFTNIFKEDVSVVNLRDLERFSEEPVVTPELLLRHGMVKKHFKVKVLGQGELKFALKVQAHAFSVSAKDKLEKAGGSAEVIGVAS